MTKKNKKDPTIFQQEEQEPVNAESIRFFSQIIMVTCQVCLG